MLFGMNVMIVEAIIQKEKKECFFVEIVENHSWMGNKNIYKPK